MKIIFITGVSDPHFRREVANAGADAFFFKPLDIMDFVDTVQRLLTSAVPSMPQPASQAVAEGVETIIEPSEPEPEPEPEMGVSERLTLLKNDIGAVSVVLISDQGQNLVQVGDFPMPDVDTSLLPLILSNLNTSQKLSHFLGMSIPDNFFVIRGLVFNLVAAPVGKNYGLFAFIESDAEKLPTSYGPIIQAAVVDLLEILAYMGVEMDQEIEQAVPAPSLETEAAAEEVPLEIDDELDALLSKGLEPVKKESVDLDSFWDVDEEEPVEEIPGMFDSGVLTYDQALQLGLAPEEE